MYAASANKLRVCRALGQICTGSATEFAATVRDLYADEFESHNFCPIDEIDGREALTEKFWRPLRKSFPDLERRDLLVLSGEHEGSEFVALMGHYQGTFLEDWLGIPASKGVVHLRYGEIHRMAGARIAGSHTIVDLLDLMRQAGCWPIGPSAGAEGMWPGPAAEGGLHRDRVDPVAGAEAVEVVANMHRALLSFDGHDIESMNLAQFWTENFMWYGPSGIGTTRGLPGFRAHHQIPFLRAFPDRTLGDTVALLGDGNYVAIGGWPGVTATHTGGDWLGLPPTGRHVDMRLMDFYRLESGRIAENWVPIDIIDILRQLGTDVLARLRHLNGAHATQI